MGWLNNGCAFVNIDGLKLNLLTVLLLIGISPALAVSLDQNAFSDAFVTKRAQIKLQYETLDLPKNEAMGILGASYLVEVSPEVFLGPAAYGAIYGDRGGFYSFGGELAWHHLVYPSLELQTGLYVGGGGGAGGNAYWGGGLMLRPHADLLWRVGDFKAGVSASNVTFPDGGQADSSQLGLVLVMDTQLSYTNPDYVGHQLETGGRQGLGFDRVVPTAGIYFVEQGSKKIGGAPQDNQLEFVGARLEHFVTPEIYVGLEAIGSVSNGADGYAEFLGTVGYEQPLVTDLTLGARLGLGTAGGGNVDVGGGFLAKVEAYATYDLTMDTHLSLEAGYTTAPDGHFDAFSTAMNLVFDLDHPFNAKLSQRIVEQEFSMGTAHYFSASTKAGPSYAADLVTIKMNHYLNDNLYLTGQTHWTYGGNFPGYGVGLFGLGYRSDRMANGIRAGLEMLAGGGGGASVDTRGAILQPMAFVEVPLLNQVSIKAGFGELISVKGNLATPVVDLAVNFDYGATGR